VWIRVGVSCPVTLRKAEPYRVEHHGVITGEVRASVQRRASSPRMSPGDVERCGWLVGRNLISRRRLHRDLLDRGLLAMALPDRKLRSRSLLDQGL
jgi:hypothetical protein